MGLDYICDVVYSLNPSISAAIITSVTTILITIIVASFYKTQRKIDTNYKGKEFLMQKRIIAYETIFKYVGNMKSFIPVPEREREDAMHIFFNSYKAPSKYEKGNTEVTIMNDVYRALYCCNFAINEESYIKCIQDLNTLYVTNTMYLSNKVNDKIIDLIVIINQYFNEYLIYSAHLSKYSDKKRKYVYEKTLILFAYILKDVIANKVLQIEDEIIKELKLVKFITRKNYDFSKPLNQIELLERTTNEIEDKTLIVVEKYLKEILIPNINKEKFEGTLPDIKFMVVLDDILNNLYEERKHSGISLENAVRKYNNDAFN